MFILQYTNFQNFFLLLEKIRLPQNVAKADFELSLLNDLRNSLERKRTAMNAVLLTFHYAS